MELSGRPRRVPRGPAITHRPVSLAIIGGGAAGLFAVFPR